MPTVSVAEAAKRLSKSQSTVRAMLDREELKGHRGQQPTRKRWIVDTDEDGWLVDSDGLRLLDQTPPDRRLSADVHERLARIEELFAHRGLGASNDGFRTAALQLSAALDRQRRAFALQSEATKELNDALTDQAAIITGLLLPNDAASLTGGTRAPSV